jgi:CubicO group peptidase (beta-lactamase class C family)
MQKIHERFAGKGTKVLGINFQNIEGAAPTLIGEGRMNKSKVLFLLLIFVLTAFSQFAFSQSDKAKKIDKYVTPFVSAGHFSGVILASENGKVIYEKAFGLANADYKIPNQLNTRIGIASITKPMTVVITNRLVESGKISLDDKLSKYIPIFRTATRSQSVI